MCGNPSGLGSDNNKITFFFFGSQFVFTNRLLISVGNSVKCKANYNCYPLTLHLILLI